MRWEESQRATDWPQGKGTGAVGIEKIEQAEEMRSGGHEMHPSQEAVHHTAWRKD